MSHKISSSFESSSGGRRRRGQLEWLRVGHEWADADAPRRGHLRVSLGVARA